MIRTVKSLVQKIDMVGSLVRIQSCLLILSKHLADLPASCYSPIDIFIVGNAYLKAIERSASDISALILAMRVFESGFDNIVQLQKRKKTNTAYQTNNKACRHQIERLS